MLTQLLTIDIEKDAQTFYLLRFFKNPLKIFKKGMDPVAMMETVVGLMRTMKAFGYDVEEELFKDHKKYKHHHKIKGYREAIQ